MLIEKSLIHRFTASTAKRWRFQSRVTLVNKTGVDNDFEVVVRDQDGQLVATGGTQGCIPVGAATQVDLDELAARLGVGPRAGELLFTFSLVPVAYRNADGPVEIAVEEILRMLSAQDHYIEHYEPSSGFAAGVCYYTPPLNDPAFAPRFSLLMQAPKIFLTENRNTVFQVFFYSSVKGFDVTGAMHCRLRGGAGAPIVEWTERIPPLGLRYIDVKEVLARNGKDWRTVVAPSGFLFFEAYSPDYSFIPLTFNINERLRTFDMEHSLPPTDYSRAVTGQLKRDIIAAGLRLTGTGEASERAVPAAAAARLTR
jgi:hypothetical protein